MRIKLSAVNELQLNKYKSLLFLVILIIKPREYFVIEIIVSMFYINNIYSYCKLLCSDSTEHTYTNSSSKNVSVRRYCQVTVFSVFARFFKRIQTNVFNFTINSSFLGSFKCNQKLLFSARTIRYFAVI